MSYQRLRCPKGHSFGTYVYRSWQRIECPYCRSEAASNLNPEPAPFSPIPSYESPAPSPAYEYPAPSPAYESPAPSPSSDSFSSGGGGDFGGGGASGSWSDS